MFELAFFFLLFSMFVDYYSRREPMNAAWNTSIVIAMGLPAGPPLPVMGLPGIRVMIQSAMNTMVPAIPIAYQGIPHFLSSVLSRILEQFLLQ
jgi:hypothetical protein